MVLLHAVLTFASPTMTGRAEATISGLAPVISQQAGTMRTSRPGQLVIEYLRQTLHHLGCMTTRCRLCSGLFKVTMVAFTDLDFSQLNPTPPQTRQLKPPVADKSAVRRMDPFSLVAEYCADSGHTFAFLNAKILSRGNDRVARETIEAWHTETTSVNRCVALLAAYQALRTQLNELKNKREVRPDVNPNTGEPSTDLHVATPQIGPDEGAVINTVASTSTPANGEKRSQRDAIKASNRGRPLRSTRMRAMATNVQMPPPPPQRETGRFTAVTLPPALPRRLQRRSLCVCGPLAPKPINPSPV
ncbi:hypothetical protein SprV_0100005200 [Sparganum proliferum]